MPVIQKQFSTLGLVSLALAGLLSPVACGDGEVPKPDAAAGKGGSAGKAGTAGKGGGAQGGEGGDAGAGPTVALPLEAPAAREAGAMKLAEELSDVVELGDFSVGFGAKTAYLLDFNDPTAPDSVASFPTKSAPVGAAFDPARQVAFLLARTGQLQAFFVANPKSASRAASLDLGEKTALGVARVGDRLFVLGAETLTPVTLKFDSDGALNGFKEEKVVTLKGAATHIAAGGGQLYIAMASGDIDVYSSTTAPKRNDTYSLGGAVVGWVARGTQIFAAVKDLGLKVVDFAASGGPSELWSAPDASDVQAFKRSGNLAVVGLARNLTVAFDVSDLTAPRPLVSREGAVPAWVAPSKGNFVLASGKSLSVLGVPPFVAASVPTGLRSNFPRYGRIPLQLSKPVDPKTLSTKTVELSCGGKVVATSLSISPDNGRLTLLPTKTLPAGADCSVTFDGVKDPLGLLVSSPGPLGIQTSMASPGAVESKKSSYPHGADGAFTDWKAGTKEDYEYKDVAAAQGMYSKFYADFDGKKLWILNDWFYNGDAIEPDCYNQFSVYTGGGSEYWDIRAYGDQHIEVRLNNQLVSADDANVVGGYSHTATPNDAKPHTVYEIAVTTKPGSWSLSLSDPGPTFACNQLETDPTTYDGQSDAMQSSVDPTRVPVKPLAPTLGRNDTLTSLTPTLGWSSGDEAGNFTTFLFELVRGTEFGTPMYRHWVYGKSFTLPTGLIGYGTTYAWRVTGYNLAGTAQSDTQTFSVRDPNAVVAPKLAAVQPNTAVQGAAVSLSLSGSGFVAGAQAFLDDVAVSTTYLASDGLTVMLSAQNTGTVGDHVITVRNAVDDTETASNGLAFTVTTRQVEGCLHSECSSGERLDPTCSTCATDVCAEQAHAYCCQQTWDAACIERAATLKTCDCETGAGGAGGEAGQAGAGGAGVAGTSGVGGAGTSGTGGNGGGAAAAGGTAGMDGGSCTSTNCANIFLGFSTTPSFNAACDAASKNWEILHSCACSSACSIACEAQCFGGSTMQDGCGDCIQNSCPDQFQACMGEGT